MVQLMVERLWPGATSDAVSDCVAQVQSRCAELAGDGIPIRYLGATFVPGDESLSCRFDGTPQAVRAACRLAGATFDRLVEIREMSCGSSPTRGDVS
jgi:hypothetical protein